MPAGFGPIAPHWKPRVDLAGTYDQKWEQERQPLLPFDFDDRFYQFAPEDQQVPGFLNGGEWVELYNLTPDGTLRFRLPDIGQFLWFSTRLSNETIHHHAKLYTVIIEPDYSRFSMVWCTHINCHGKEHKLEKTEINFEGLSKPRISIIIGLPSSRPGFPDNMGDVVIDAVQTEIGSDYIDIVDIKTISCGHASGLMAIENGCQYIHAGKSDFVLAGGIDSYISPVTLEWLDFEEQLHSVINRYGFIPGEAAGFCLLASETISKQFGCVEMGKIRSIGFSREKNLIKTDTVCTGEGLTRVFQNVLKQNDKIDKIICDLNGERYRVDEFGFTLSRIGDRFKAPSNAVTPSDCWGGCRRGFGPSVFNTCSAIRFAKVCEWAKCVGLDKFGNG